ncbi:LPS assembly lipoprotein LptE [Rouxiella badensis]|jgi:LPS-assembly lipoprotein|uniref:LPS-assembly lipoprotein LptE n=1 Tax=Rouxiella badensis TaxID=1646377 RepID=A0A1X0WLA2_9GAMM|nr:LPS assembly lipoprotein LptE [Rouxiella badensis]MCC3702294.1 LPS assembly lipoprotein LptE [Rouxiella badensis]MCC3717300.1 LPS assembly lipoprotein LptE [Rouxiella badensis]MCC3728396.1 LPS assembly lipoprotein LptE [Rouxiella badensis]MCC3732300.1 LPS assembly lipoprotein LptE [Rouxiella badensis]MCC3740140.1 LPS assembly lipoprotein LptE [Rouxiella badensis]
MRNRILMLLLGAIVLVTSGCGFHLRGTTNVPSDLKTITLNSYDPYGPLTREIRSQLKLSDVTVVEPTVSNKKSLPELRIVGATESQATASIFQDGKTAEYQKEMTVRAQVLMPGKDIYPISVTVFRSFFDNPLAALAKDAEQDIIDKEMREQAAQQLIRKLLTVHASELTKKDVVDGTPEIISVGKAPAASTY